MTSFVDDNGTYLDYSGEDFTLQKQVASILNLKIKGDVSVNFELDNNSVNRTGLGFYGPLQISSPVLTKIPYNIERNGNRMMRGFIVVQEVNERKLQCFFISGNSSWIADFQFNIQDINLNDFSVAWTYTAMIARKTATSGVVFPLVDWAYKGMKFPAMFLADRLNLKLADDGTGVLTDGSCDFYPCLYLHTLLEETFKNAQYVLGGNLLTDQMYKSAILTPESGELTIPETYIKQREAFTRLEVGWSPDCGGPTCKLDLLGVYGPFSNSLHRWTADASYLIQITVNLSFTVNQAYTISVVKNGGPITFTYTFTGTSLNYTFEFISAVAGDYFEVNGDTAAFAYLINAGSSVLFTLTTQVIPLNAIVVNSIVPSMPAVDLVKMAATRFGCVVNFDPNAKKIYFNKIDKITATENWSEYLTGYEFIYQYGFKNNYIKLPDSPEFELYNSVKPEGYGGANIETDFEVNQDKDLYRDPFGGALDSINALGNGLVQSNVNLLDCQDGDSFTVSSVTNSGGYATFNVTGYKSNQNNTIIRSNCPSYIGYHVVFATTATTVITLTPYTNTSSGQIYAQDVSFADVGARLLTCIPDYAISNLGPISTIDVYSSPAGHVSHSTWPYAYFSKPTTLRGVDQLKQSLSYGRIDADGYNDEPMVDSSMQTHKKMLNGPVIRARFRLPEAVFASFNFDKKIQLFCKDFSGVFWVDTFRQYKDSKTEVEVDLLIT